MLGRATGFHRAIGVHDEGDRVEQGSKQLRWFSSLDV